ncbi:hypothetical protein H8E07_17795 [bacterium]|nr:hypothetical protein [bacterium]
MKRLINSTSNPFSKSHLLAMLAVLAAVFIFTGCSEEPLMGPQDVDQSQAQSESDGSSAILTTNGDKNPIVPIDPVPVPPNRRFVKDTDLTGSATPQLDANNNIIGWDIAIAGIHYETPVDYTGNIVGGQFTPALPGLPWLHDDAEMLPSFETAFVFFSNDPYVLTHQGTTGGIIDAPLSNTSWGKLLARGPRNLDPNDFVPADFDRSVFDHDMTFVETKSSTQHVTVHDPATGLPLTDADAAKLLVSRGLPATRVDAFLRGQATSTDLASLADKDGIQVTVGAEVSIEISIPPFVSVTVTGSVSLTGDLDDYEELAAKARELAQKQADKLAEEVKEQLKKLKELLKWIIEQLEPSWWPF